MPLVVMYRGEVSDALMAAMGLDVGANLSAEERFKQVAAVMKRRDAQDRQEQRELRRQQKLDKKVSHVSRQAGWLPAIGKLLQP